MDETGNETKAKRAMSLEDRTGFGLLGLTAGIVGAFVVSYFALVPALAGDRSLTAVTWMTVATMGLMIVGGGLGYYLTRRPNAPAGRPAK